MQDQLKVGPLTLTFHRTTRVPDTSALGKSNALPASLGTFPLLRAGDLGANRPEAFHPESFLIPIWNREALWIGIRADTPVAVSVGAGKINAVTGKILESKLVNDAANPQSYLVAPPQPWIDGFKTEDGSVRQFVAVKLGSGETAEGQITGKEEVGGLQFGIHLPKVDLITVSKPVEHHATRGVFSVGGATRGGSFGGEKSLNLMGLGAGGKIKQKIYEDPYVAYSHKRADEIWHEATAFKALVHLVHASQWEELTGQKAPPTPVTFEVYQKAGIPWFALYDEDFTDVKPSDVLANLKPVSGAPSAHFAEGNPKVTDEKTEDLW